MASEELQVRVRKAARAVARHGLAHAYGHVSARIDETSFLVCAAMPMGMIAAGTPGAVVPLDGGLPDGVLGEVRIHREIYRSRPEIHGVCRTMPAKIMSLSTLRLTPRPRHCFGSYFFPGIPLWDDPLLIRDDSAAERLAKEMEASSAIVMLGNGLITAGDSIEEAVVRAWFAEDAARVEFDVMAAGTAGDPALFSSEQAGLRAIWSGRILERMWDYMTSGDPE